MKEFSIIIAVITSIMLAMLVGANEYMSWQCENYSEITGRETKFISWDTCYIKVDDEWIRYDSSYRRVEK